MLARIPNRRLLMMRSASTPVLMVQPIMEGGSLQIETLSPKVVLWNIPGVSWVATLSMDC